MMKKQRETIRSSLYTDATKTYRQLTLETVLRFKWNALYVP
jgi:hypothetical protein